MDFVGDVLQRFSQHVPPEIIHQLGSEIRRDYGGSREYIAKRDLSCPTCGTTSQGRDLVILRDKERGLSIQEIATRHGVHRKTVHAALRRARQAR